MLDSLLNFTSEKVKQMEEVATEEKQEEDGVVPLETSAGGADLVEEEEQDAGVVKGHVYATYWKAVGKCLSPMVLLSLLLMQGKSTVKGVVTGLIPLYLLTTIICFDSQLNQTNYLQN